MTEISEKKKKSYTFEILLIGIPTIIFFAFLFGLRNERITKMEIKEKGLETIGRVVKNGISLSCESIVDGEYRKLSFAHKSDRDDHISKKEFYVVKYNAEDFSERVVDYSQPIVPQSIDSLYKEAQAKIIKTIKDEGSFFLPGTTYFAKYEYEINGRKYLRSQQISKLKYENLNSGNHRELYYPIVKYFKTKPRVGHIFYIDDSKFQDKTIIFDE
ncbi:hypothetical protein [Flammeovirga sp. SJP92]|uniref:hypothetical protein n=1 Tax=Flammeovirga sp. SJP92 TaxID=1775430 RepID=UPI000786D055|nr:hypothetical protein [Flammeovirga sp. SJP92]KXX69355.1 hypothetical protein AVL50_19730 [Flammeovirga sp. SJP92]